MSDGAFRGKHPARALTRDHQSTRGRNFRGCFFDDSGIEVSNDIGRNDHVRDQVKV